MKSVRYIFSGWRKMVIEALLIVLVFWAVRYYQQQDMTTGVAPPIQGMMLDQNEIDWPAYKGKPLLIQFWATWCPVCRYEEDSIQSISADYNVLTIASWSEDTATYMKEQGLDFATLDDPQGVWASRYGIKAVPATFIVNSEGKIDYIETGFSSEIGLRLRLWSLEL